MDSDKTHAIIRVSTNLSLLLGSLILCLALGEGLLRVFPRLLPVEIRQNVALRSGSSVETKIDRCVVGVCVHKRR